MKLKKLGNERLFDFVITVPETVDKEGDVVPGNEIEEALDGWLVRDAPVIDVHTNRVVGKGVRWWKNADGEYIGRALVHDNMKMADDVWKNIKSGKYKSVSIGGAAWNKTPNDSGGYDLKGLEIAEVSVCPEGMHQDANIIDKNEFAKATPFFFKAKISSLVGKPFANYKNFDECVRQNQDKKDPAAYCGKIKSLTEKSEGVTLNESGSEWVHRSFTVNQPNESGVEKFKNLKTGGKFMSNAKKMEPETDGVSERLTALEMGQQKILELLSAKPAEETEVAEAEDEEEKPVEKPVEKPEEEMEKEGGIGTEEVNPSKEGGEVKIPENPDDKRKEPGEEPEEETDESGAEMEKKVKSLVRKEIASFKKSFKKSSTPLPTIEKSVVPKAREYPAWEVAKGNKTINDFVKDSRIEKMQRTIDMHKEFENYRNGGRA